MAELPVWLKLTLMVLIVLSSASQIFLSDAGRLPLFSDKIPDERQNRLKHVIDAYGFTRREQEVLEQILAGKATREIAQTLFISESTVKHYVGRLLLRCGVKSHVALLAKLNQEAGAGLSPL